jgi:putative heme transporter
VTGASSLWRWGAYAAKATLVVAVVTGGLWTATHGVAGVRWTDVAVVLRGLPWWRFAVLSAVWLGGLIIYAVVLAAALPGLGLRRSLLLNLSGSAVANVVPLGGAVATALNWRMVRTWGHSNRAFVTFCVLTNALDALAKLMLPVVAVAVLLTLSVHVPETLWVLSAVCGAGLVTALGLRAALRRTGASWSPEGRWTAAAQAWMRDSGARVSTVFVDRWHRLLPASIGYVAAQVVLLYVALRAVGLEVPGTAVLVAAAIERVATLIPLTPGGTGVAEVGTIAWLTATGLDPADVVAGVLLYRAFLVVMEIPVGGLLLAGWAWVHRGATVAARPHEVTA